jgi:uncharacterized Zn finger protein (UPF0148 family)
MTKTDDSNYGISNIILYWCKTCELVLTRKETTGNGHRYCPVCKKEVEETSIEFYNQEVYAEA